MWRSFVGWLALILAAQSSPAAEPVGVAFDQASGYAVVDDAVRFDLATFTLSASVRLDQLGDSGVIMSRGGAGELFTLYAYDGRVRMLVEFEPGRYAHANVPQPPQKQWVQVTGTYDGQAIKLYVDGMLEAEVLAQGRIPASLEPLKLGALGPGVRPWFGRLDRLAVFDRALDAEEVAQLAAADDVTPMASLVSAWTAETLTDSAWKNVLPDGPQAIVRPVVELICRKDSGYRGIWYANQPQEDEYVYKYSGGLGTYCAKHGPMAIYAAEVHKTFFCYGGTDEENSTLLHMVS